MAITLNIIGCGKLGKTLGRLWQQSKLVDIRGVVTRSLESADQACAFIGDGQAHTTHENLPSASLWLLATPDNDLQATASLLHNSGLINEHDTLFHCSGSLSSAVMAGPATKRLVSVHPVHSFANPETSLNSFPGSYCAIEGELQAQAIVKPLFTGIGGELFSVNSDAKALYHSASVLACNALVGLLDASLEVMRSSGIEDGIARKILLPIVQRTVDNTLTGSPQTALTGPVSRGDHTTVARQLEQLQTLKPDIADIYRSLGGRTLEIAVKQGLNKDASEQLQTVFKGTP